MNNNTIKELIEQDDEYRAEYVGDNYLPVLSIMKYLTETAQIEDNIKNIKILQAQIDDCRLAANYTKKQLQSYMIKYCPLEICADKLCLTGLVAKREFRVKDGFGHTHIATMYYYKYDNLVEMVFDAR